MRKYSLRRLIRREAGHIEVQGFNALRAQHSRFPGLPSCIVWINLLEGFCSARARCSTRSLFGIDLQTDRAQARPTLSRGSPHVFEDLVVLWNSLKQFVRENEGSPGLAKISHCLQHRSSDARNLLPDLRHKRRDSVWIDEREDDVVDVMVVDDDAAVTPVDGLRNRQLPASCDAQEVDEGAVRGMHHETQRSTQGESCGMLRRGWCAAMPEASPCVAIRRLRRCPVTGILGNGKTKKREVAWMDSDCDRTGHVSTVRECPVGP